MHQRAPGSIEWLGRTGKFWYQARKFAKIEPRQLAEGLGIDIDELHFFESGLTDPETVYGDLPKRYADTLGHPELYDLFCERFNIPPFAPQSNSAVQK